MDLSLVYYPVSDTSGDGVLFSIDFFVFLLAGLRENGWTDLHEISEVRSDHGTEPAGLSSLQHQRITDASIDVACITQNMRVC